MGGNSNVPCKQGNDSSRWLTRLNELCVKIAYMTLFEPRRPQNAQSFFQELRESLELHLATASDDDLKNALGCFRQRGLVGVTMEDLKTIRDMLLSKLRKMV